MKLYIAGPMTGIAQFNFPAFSEAAHTLRARGHEVWSPHELDSPEVQAAAWASPDGKLHDGVIGGETWGQILGRDVRIVADDVEGLALLPDWHRSRGARLEAFVGLLCKRRFFEYAADMEERGFDWVRVRIL